MRDDVPFSQVLELVEKHGYRLLKRVSDAADASAGLAIFICPGRPNLGVRIEHRKVKYEYYQAIHDALEGRAEEAGG